MQPDRLKSHPKLALLSILAIVLSATTLATVQPPANATISNLQPPIPNLQKTATQTVQIPLVMRNWSATATSAATVVLGTEFAPFQEEDEVRYAEVVGHDLPRVRSAGFTSIRTHIYWREIEPTNTEPDSFNWTRYDERLQDYGEYGLDPIVGIVAYPSWATPFACGGGLFPGLEPEWREFVRAAAEHYSRPPFNVHIWEIGNEVDGETEVDLEEDTERPPEMGGNEPTWPFGGCWGDIAPQYVDFLRIAYEEIKAVNPDATVMLGGLAYTEFDHWFIESFFDDFLTAGGGAYTDVVGFHWFKPFQTNWPTAAAKARELQSIMADHNIDNKPMWLTEAYMPDRMGDRDTRQERYTFITQDIPRTLGSGEIDRLYWYGFSDWPAGWSDIDRGLVTLDHQPKPGLKVFEIMAEFVGGAPSPADLPGVEAYRFRRPQEGEENWVVWSKTDEAHTISLPVSGTSVTALRVEQGDRYTTTRPVLVNVEIDEDNAHIPVGPEAVFVRIRKESQ